MPLKNKDMLDLEQITKKVREIALQGGAFLRNERSSFDRAEWKRKMLMIMCLMWTRNRNTEL